MPPSPTAIPTCGCAITSAPCSRMKPLPLCSPRAASPPKPPLDWPSSRFCNLPKGSPTLRPLRRCGRALTVRRIFEKYALGLELTDCGFDASVLSEFRARLVAGSAEQQLLDTLLARFRAAAL